jgi:hypothetical protein
LAAAQLDAWIDKRAHSKLEQIDFFTGKIDFSMSQKRSLLPVIGDPDPATRSAFPVAFHSRLPSVLRPAAINRE